MLCLNGPWKVNHFPYRSDISSVLEPNFVPEGWLTANVPEDIHATLRRAGVILGNTYNKREDEEQWIELADWVYYKEFFCPEELSGEHCFLRFEGLDTFCEIYLNGVLVGGHDNMHTPCQLAVSCQLRSGMRNTLVVRFFSPVRFVENRDQREVFSITTSERMFARKAQMNYSWDFCGRCVTVGIWKDVTLFARRGPRLGDYYLQTLSLAQDSASILLETEMDWLCGPEDGCRVEASLSLAGQEVLRAEGTPEDMASCTLTLPHPELWWPVPYGSQPLYDFRLVLTQNGKVLDERKQKFGVRTIRLLQELQADGKSFQFEVNGRRLFLRGANWVPANTVYTDIRPKDYELLLHSAVHGRISMLRIWGGGIYEPAPFFDQCDQFGILVWNDFMLSCGIYPQDEAFQQTMAKEAEHVLRTYRNRACLAIWAGDNENGQAYGWAGRPFEFDRDKIGFGVLKEACQRLDPLRPYIETSPASPDPNLRGGDNPSSPYQGDLHLYIMSADPGKTAWRDYGKDYYKRVLGFRPRFVSEFGFISLPEKDSFYRFNFRREPLRDPREIIKFLPFTKAYVEQNEMDQLIHFSQVFNAMALQYWIEYFRSLKGTCSGTLYWKFNDPLADCPDIWMYPSHMCAIDMYLKPKMTYYYTRRAYAETLVLLTEQLDGGWTLGGVTEALNDLPGTLTLSRRSFAGKELQRLTYDTVLKADAATVVASLPKDSLIPDDPLNEYLLLRFETQGQRIENRYFFADLNEINRLKLEEAHVCVKALTYDGQSIAITLESDRYARCVRLNMLDVRADYSDNYFDIDPGEQRQVLIELPDGPVAREQVLYVEGENLPRMVVPLPPLCEAGACGERRDSRAFCID